MVQVLPGGPAAPGGASVRRIKAAVGWPTSRPVTLNAFVPLAPFMLSNSALTFSYALSNRAHVVSCDGCVVEKDILAGVVAVYEVVFLFYVILFNGSYHALLEKRLLHAGRG